ncbi:MAG: hypothetical protein E7311_05015 [Clostridiales bacterium]|nr:hypothetical protein [Clostridiales bacterium]
MRNLKNSKTSGISLVALIVTIIVLIILTAAVIVTFMEGGIIEKAKEAVFKSDIRTYQEILAVKNAEKQIELATGNGEGGVINETEYEKIKKIIPEFKEEYKDLVGISNGEIVLGTRTDDPYSIWLTELGIGVAKTSAVALFKVGDYVDYNIPEADREVYKIAEEETYWIFNDIDEDYSYDEGEDIIEYQDIMWRVLKNDGTKVTLVSTNPVEKINFYEANGYTYGPDILNEICAKVYGGRNLKVEDVNEVLKMKPVPYYYNIEGTKVNKELGTTFGDVIIETGYDVREWYFTSDDEKLDLAYSYGKSDCINVSEIEKELIFRDTEYWLASTCADVYFNSGEAYFNTYYVGNNYLNSFNLGFASGGGTGECFAIRPVVTLSSSTQIANVTGDGSSADNPWQLK